MTKRLSVALAAVGEIEARLQKSRQDLARIRKEKDAVIEHATGPDDNEALDKLNALASQESLVTRQLQIAQRELDGQTAALLNEATSTRNKVLEALYKHKQTLLEKLDDKLTEFFPSVRDRKKAVASLTPTPPALFQVSKFISGLTSQNFTPGSAQCHATELGFAKAVLGSAERAVAECLN